MWRRDPVRLLANLLLVVMALAFAAPTLADEPDQVAITTEGAEVGGTQLGTFVATGAIVDAGTYAFDLDSHKAFAFAGFGAPTFGIARSLEFFTGQNGSFTLQNVVRFSLTDSPGVFAVEGTWAVVSGTRAYAALRGQGTITGVIDASGAGELFTFEFTGTAHSQ
jgi:hypothetical protein